MMERDKKKVVIASDDDDYKEHVVDHEILLSIELRGGIAAGKSTPSPAWKLEEEGELGFVERPRKSVSARSLGANLWEMKDLLPEAGIRRKSGRQRRRRDGGDMGGVDLPPLGSPDQLPSAGNLRNLVATPLIQLPRKSNERNSFALQPKSPDANSSFLEATPYNPTISPCSLLNRKGKNGDAGYSVRTSSELLKVLNHIFSLEQQHASNITLVKSLKKELIDARAYIQELLVEQKAYYRKVGDLVSQVEEDILVRKNKEEDRMKAVVHSLREELDDEMRLRQKCESLHHKVGKELSKTKKTLSNTLKDLENERKSNSLLEDLCDELAKGIKQYEKKMGELKEKYTEDCEHRVDGIMLHISETWLEKRLQMLHCDQNEKITIASRLKAEIISFLQALRAKNIKDENEQYRARILQRQSLESLHLNGTVSAPCEIEDDGSIVSDLHCFELNMDKTNAGSHDQLKSQYQACHTSIQAESSSMPQEGLNEKLKGKEFSNITDLQTEANRGEDTTIRKSTNSSSLCGYGRKIDDMEDSSLSHYPMKNLSENSSGCKVHNFNYRGETNHTKFPQLMHFFSNNVDDVIGNVQIASSPVQQWKYGRSPTELEIPRCSMELPLGMTGNTLKAKLLQARSEGRNARLKAMNGASIEAKGH